VAKGPVVKHKTRTPTTNADRRGKGMSKEDNKYNEAMITLTSYPEWELFVKELANEIYQTQANALEAEDWGDLNKKRGVCEGLARVINLRDDTKFRMQVEDDNADL
jgi:hypothetical protein